MFSWDFFHLYNMDKSQESCIIICACGRGETGRRAVFRRQFFGVRVRIPSTAPIFINLFNGIFDNKKTKDHYLIFSFFSLTYNFMTIRT